jgi:hypothetical protein
LNGNELANLNSLVASFNSKKITLSQHAKGNCGRAIITLLERAISRS